jgi:hypothetical protein
MIIQKKLHALMTHLLVVNVCSMAMTCRRPARVCFCPALPQQPLRLKGKVIVLQHPHESK